MMEETQREVSWLLRLAKTDRVHFWSPTEIIQKINLIEQHQESCKTNPEYTSYWQEKSAIHADSQDCHLQFIKDLMGNYWTNDETFEMLNKNYREILKDYIELRAKQITSLEAEMSILSKHLDLPVFDDQHADEAVHRLLDVNPQKNVMLEAMKKLYERGSEEDFVCRRIILLNATVETK